MKYYLTTNYTRGKLRKNTEPFTCDYCKELFIEGDLIYRTWHFAYKGGVKTNKRYYEKYHWYCFFACNIARHEQRREKTWVKEPRQGRLKSQDLSPETIKFRRNLTQYISQDRKRLLAAAAAGSNDRMRKAAISLTLHYRLRELHGGEGNYLLTPACRKIVSDNPRAFGLSTFDISQFSDIRLPAKQQMRQWDKDFTDFIYSENKELINEWIREIQVPTQIPVLS